MALGNNVDIVHYDRPDDLLYALERGESLEPFSAIVTDLHFRNSGLTGHDVATRIRAMNERIPIVLSTNAVSDEVVCNLYTHICGKEGMPLREIVEAGL